MTNPDLQPSPGVNGRSSASTSSRCRFEVMESNGSSGFKNASRLRDAAYVESSNIPWPHGGRRELIEAWSGPAKLIVPKGPEIDHAHRLRSVSRMSMSASPVLG